MSDLFTNNNVDIYSSREQIRNQLVQYAQNYLDLKDVDLYKTSFLSYIINVMSILSANELFFSSTMYREFFLLLAQHQESVHNLAKWIGYYPPKATPASVDVLFTVPLGFTDPEVYLQIPYNFQVKSGDIPFTIATGYNFDATFNSQYDEVVSKLDDTSIEILRNRIVTVRDPNGFYRPVSLTKTSTGLVNASFILPFRQIEGSYNSFQIPDDLEFYEFYSKKITGFKGQVSEIDVYVFEPDHPSIDILKNVSTVEDFYSAISTEDRSNALWTESKSGLYTLTQSNKQYIWTTIPNEIEITFGNGVIGQQPAQRSTVAIILWLSMGEDGNVIPSSIVSGEPIYYKNSNNKMLRVKYNITNPNRASGGSDAPSLAEIKSNALTYLTSKERLVSDGDYNDFNTIVSDIPLEGTLPILKRSDLKVNEISLFSKLIYNNPNNTNGEPEVVPTRNITWPIDGTNFYIIAGSSPSGDNSEFETVFNMQADILTNVASYEYIINNIEVPTALQNPSDTYYDKKLYLLIPSCTVTSIRDSSAIDIIEIKVEANVNHIPTYDDSNNLIEMRCKIVTDFDDDSNLMTTILNTENPDIIDSFEYIYPNITSFPLGEVQFKLHVQAFLDGLWQTISVYEMTTIIKRDLSDFMMSTITSDGLTYTIHDVPVIMSEYLKQDGFDWQDFELNVLQKLISNVNVTSKRMLTDFLNIKFPNTTGKLTNMKYNPLSDYNVISRNLDIIPTSPFLGDTYIVNGSEMDSLSHQRPWKSYVDYIAQWNGHKWTFTAPTFNEFIKINNIYDPTDIDNGKKLIWTGSEWFEPIFDIPFNIELKIEINNNVTSTNGAIVENIKTALLNYFTPKFGMDVDIDRSEILKITRSVDGVEYCEVVKPETNIRFNYELQDLSLTDLLDYTPELVAFTEDTISIIIINE